MKLFLKDHLEFIFIYFLQLCFLLLLGGLDLVLQGFSITLPTLFYMFILSTSILILFLVYRYLRLIPNYRVMNEEWSDVADALQPFAENTAIYKSLNKRLEEVFQHYTRNISTQTRAKDQYYTFIHQWVHQMKTPISVMSLMLKVEEGNLPKQSLEEEIEKLRDGLEFVLHAARLDYFEKDMKIEQVSLVNVMRNVIEIYKKSFIRNGVFPEMKMGDFVVETDRKWLAFVVGQIISNAIKYSVDKGKKIVISTVVRKDAVDLIIEDEGYGIPEQDISRVFEPFFTGTNGRTVQESTGMGLFLCKTICENLGHELHIESTVGEGTALTITFHHIHD